MSSDACQDGLTAYLHLTPLGTTRLPGNGLPMGAGHTDFTRPMWASVVLSGCYCTSFPTLMHTFYSPAYMMALMHYVPAVIVHNACVV